MEREIRSFNLKEIRAVEEEGQPSKIIGYAAVYNQPSEDMGFIEYIEPGFFSNVLEGDTRALWNHNADKPLGRTTNGTLTLEDDELGLRVSITPSETSWGRDAMVSIGRGDVNQMSFAFSVKEGGDTWYTREDGKLVRTLKAGGAAGLYDVSPVTYPAYPTTSAAVRSTVKKLTAEHAAGGSDSVQSERARKLKILDIEIALNQRGEK